MRSTRLGPLLLAAAAGIAACGDPAAPDPGPVGIIGSYELRTIDGHALPHDLPTGAPGGAVQVTRGEARMGAGGVCSLSFAVRLVIAGVAGPPQDVDYGCTYTVDDPDARESAVSILVEGEDEPSEGTYRDGRLSFTFLSGRALAFER